MISYPCTLPDFKTGKSREQVQTFRTTPPFVGPIYIEQITDESPVTWDVEIVCASQVQARQFQAFLRKIKGGVPFTKAILTEEGHVEHEVRFIVEPRAPKQISKNVWSYSGTIYARALIQKDAFICDDELILCRLQDAACIDNALNGI